MSLRCKTPCDFGPCPYDAEYSGTCEYWCGACEPQDVPETWEEDEEESAEPMDILERYLAETGDTVYLGCGGWVLVGEDEKAFPTWENMIEYIKEARK